MCMYYCQMYLWILLFFISSVSFSLFFSSLSLSLSFSFSVSHRHDRKLVESSNKKSSWFLHKSTSSTSIKSSSLPFAEKLDTQQFHVSLKLYVREDAKVLCSLWSLYFCQMYYLSMCFVLFSQFYSLPELRICSCQCSGRTESQNKWCIG